MSNKELQKKRMLMYFVEAAQKIIDEEGSDAITIRKVADIAGYNSATLYNYFESVDHLIFLASMKFIRPYAEDLPNYIKHANNALEKNLLIWECFCNHSFKKPEIYYAIFFAKLNNPIHDYIRQYYELYPEDLIDSGEDISTMLLKSNIYERNEVILYECVDEGFFRNDDIDELNEMTMIIFKGMLSKVMNDENDNSIDTLINRTMKYIKIIYEAYQKNPTSQNVKH